MSERQEIIQKMLDMQRQFIEQEQKGEFSINEYYSGGDSEQTNFKSSYNELAMRLVDIAHEDKGSHR